MFFELRQYRILPGKRDEWVRFMDEVIIPFQVAKGMTIVGAFVAEEDPDLYVWIRRFEDESEDVVATTTGTRLFTLGRLEVVDGFILVAVALAVPADARLEVHVAPALAPLGRTRAAAVGATVPHVKHPARAALHHCSVQPIWRYDCRPYLRRHGLHPPPALRAYSRRAPLDHKQWA